jgi:nicotinamidase-related amidase
VNVFLENENSKRSKESPIPKNHALEKRIRQNKLAESIKMEIDQLPALDLDALDHKKTVLVIVDMLEGFTRIGNLKSDKVEALIPEICAITTYCKDKGIDILAFADEHDENSPEFALYGPHCIKGTKESEVVPEILEAAENRLTIIGKNSNDGYFEKVFQGWLSQNPHKTQFVVVGDCTDLCVKAFAQSMKYHFDRMNHQEGSVLIPANAVATYEAPNHNAFFKHYEALDEMKDKGIGIYSQTKKA